MPRGCVGKRTHPLFGMNNLTFPEEPLQFLVHDNDSDAVSEYPLTETSLLQLNTHTLYVQLCIDDASSDVGYVQTDPLSHLRLC